jgi:UrcA family protein
MLGKGIGTIAMTAVMISAVAAGSAASRPREVVVTGQSGDGIARAVEYRDLNLARAEGEHALTRRVQGAVNKVCDELVGHHMGYMEPMASCQSQSWQSAQPQVERAVQRARDIAANGWSAIAPVAIAISIR